MRVQYHASICGTLTDLSEFPLPADLWISWNSLSAVSLPRPASFRSLPFQYFKVN